MVPSFDHVACSHSQHGVITNLLDMIGNYRTVINTFSDTVSDTVSGYKNK